MHISQKVEAVVFRSDGFVSASANLYNSGFVRVLENLEIPVILLGHFPGLESPGKRLLALEISGNLLNPIKKYNVYGRQ